MITSMATKRWWRTARARPAGEDLPAGKCFMRKLYAAAAAGVTVTALGFTGAGAAGAASTVPQSAGPLIYTTSQAGYVTGGGRLFRFVATTVVVPYLQFQAGNNGSAEVVLGSRVGPPATLRVAAGGGTGSISYVWSSGTEFHTGHLYGVAPAPGDLLRLSVYYDRLGHAEAAGVIDNATVAAPKTDTRLWAFSGTRVTTYTGVHGTLLGPWTTDQVIDTTTGTSAGAVVISSPVLWNNGQNFGVWLRTTA